MRRPPLLQPRNSFQSLKPIAWHLVALIGTGMAEKWAVDDKETRGIVEERSRLLDQCQ
jgi:hypothetical protein